MIKRYLLFALLGVMVLLGGWVVKTFVLLPSEFTSQSEAVAECPSDFFTRSAVVFEALTLCTTHAVAPEKLTYAAHVAAAWLDNDQDGEVDEPQLIPALQAHQATMVMSESGLPMGAMVKVMRNLSRATSPRTLQDLGAMETNPPQRRDAAPEEVHHLIINAGWQDVFPKVFSDTDTSSTLYTLWEQAEKAGYYTYNDPTCDSACKVTEFVYLATAAYLGSQADLESDEMRLKTRQELADALPEMGAVFESSDYAYPIHQWPDGQYAHSGNITYNPVP